MGPCSDFRRRRKTPHELKWQAMKDWLIEVLDKTGISQAELARRMTAEYHLSLDRSAINKIAKDKREMTAEEMLAIAEIAQVDIPGWRRVDDEDWDARYRRLRTAFAEILHGLLGERLEAEALLEDIEAAANMSPDTTISVGDGDQARFRVRGAAQRLFSKLRS